MFLPDMSQLNIVVRHPEMRGRIELLLKQNKLSKKHIKDILQVCVLGS